jgi:hypothetical protein
LACKIEARSYLYMLLISSLGERPLGVQAGHVAATPRWARQKFGAPVAVESFGPRTSLIALVAAGVETGAIRELKRRRAQHGRITGQHGIGKAAARFHGVQNDSQKALHVGFCNRMPVSPAHERAQ